MDSYGEEQQLWQRMIENPEVPQECTLLLRSSMRKYSTWAVCGADGERELEREESGRELERKQNRQSSEVSPVVIQIPSPVMPYALVVNLLRSILSVPCIIWQTCVVCSKISTGCNSRSSHPCLSESHQLIETIRKALHRDPSSRVIVLIINRAASEAHDDKILSTVVCRGGKSQVLGLLYYSCTIETEWGNNTRPPGRSTTATIFEFYAFIWTVPQFSVQLNNKTITVFIIRYEKRPSDLSLQLAVLSHSLSIS